ncbi:hypothetical protein ABMA27_000167 [Loxostege sticticalis]|uniref:CCHC-type domain-containing protein n=1 Tax=Loxostege sticticalis TaxID=481309 RepID=A0ABR3IMD7_LOXSC
MSKSLVHVAKKLAGNSRLLVGWVSVRVTLLKPKPSRCFRCMGEGHVAHQCRVAEDRTGVCFRCGQEGHIARDCGADKPHCTLCSAAGKSANHMLGARNCPQPKQQAKAGSKLVDDMELDIHVPDTIQEHVVGASCTKK